MASFPVSYFETLFELIVPQNGAERKTPGTHANIKEKYSRSVSDAAACLSLSPGQPGKINKSKPGSHRGREAGEVRAFLFEDGGLYAERAGYCLYAADIGRRG